jgi:hypothetical protein
MHRHTLEHCTAACVPSEFHESNLLSFRLSVVNHGIGVVQSGANMPRDELATAAHLARLSLFEPFGELTH